MKTYTFDAHVSTVCVPGLGPRDSDESKAMRDAGWGILIADPPVPNTQDTICEGAVHLVAPLPFLRLALHETVRVTVEIVSTVEPPR
jgi:hypothetical protein